MNEYKSIRRKNSGPAEDELEITTGDSARVEMPVPPVLSSPSSFSSEQLKADRRPDSFIVGDARANLDDIKYALLSYYGRIYSNTSRTIPERLDALSSTYNERRDRPAALESYGRRPYGCERGSLRHRRLGSTSRFYYENGAAEVNTMLNDLRRSCESAVLKLNAASGELYSQIQNPNLREWEYTTIPQERWLPRMGNQAELRKHAIGVYRHLYNQAELNQERINALQSKMKILYMHTKPQMIKLRGDPRIGF